MSFYMGHYKFDCRHHPGKALRPIPQRGNNSAQRGTRLAFFFPSEWESLYTITHMQSRNQLRAVFAVLLPVCFSYCYQDFAFDRHLLCLLNCHSSFKKSLCSSEFQRSAVDLTQIWHFSRCSYTPSGKQINNKFNKINNSFLLFT